MRLEPVGPTSPVNKPTNQGNQENQATGQGSLHDDTSGTIRIVAAGSNPIPPRERGFSLFDCFCFGINPRRSGGYAYGSSAQSSSRHSGSVLTRSNSESTQGMFLDSFAMALTLTPPGNGLLGGGRLAESTGSTVSSKQSGSDFFNGDSFF
ncbi:hypothetical protein Rin_00007410 [Candidatus Regiella insecticola 5.15]|uniref:Uncharacterized protein n=1 Tax=Candidatus Regiella insecticola 5.15 TaxID=1005043 RepID=G2GY90_9ENTR|nr:hypothetical protein [Candidatus Regiella insecticola]EGY29281.1 hypothetical protein Rin_00007410 [Candidatus Regiella insecticola 5.15]